jgi:hypothetical protein
MVSQKIKTTRRRNINYMHAITNFKRIAGRTVSFTMAVALMGGVIASALPGTVFADALNPLTDRSLRLTSSSPGFHYLDGSGNTNFAPPGSGPNGKQTGEEFNFKVSTDSSASGTNEPIQAFTFQYCTTAAGYCSGPGSNVGNDNTIIPDGADAGTAPDAHVPDRGNDTTTTSDLNANYTSPVQGTDFDIYVNSTLSTAVWSMVASNKEETSPTTPGPWTGKNNFITLKYVSGAAIAPTSGTPIRIVFKATSTNYITNPGDGAFFVKINDYKDNTHNDPIADTAYIVDGGVTVANVMTDSIQIQTKVLETMSFSVGTTQPDTVPVPPGDKHGPCDPIVVNADINLGDPNAEYSLAPDYTWDAHSYWRLSSNSSGGATVYYSGDTLNNTVGDDINAMGGTKAVSHQGMEQFGLAYDSTADTLDNSGPDDTLTTNTHGDGFMTSLTADQALASDQQAGYKTPELLPLIAKANYNEGVGDINDDGTVAHDGTTTGGDAKFAFDDTSTTNAVPFADFTTDVVQCSTGKMRYIANISPNTPAGVYTTKINYLAAPQY